MRMMTRLAVGLTVGGFGLAAFSEEKPESFEEYERRVCLKPGPSPMDAAPRTVALTPSDGKLARPAADEISLDGTWKLYDPERDPVDMEVPGSVHAALVKAGRLPDPFFSTNDALAAEASFHDWRAVKTFTLKEEDVRGPLRLEFGGVCDECLVLLNGRQLGRHEGMFGGPDFDVTGRLRAGENRLEVYLRAAPRWKPDAPYFWHGPNDNQGWRMSVVFNCCYGWHYARIPARGIWRSVKIRKVPAVEVLEPFVATKALDGTLDFHAVLRGRGRFGGRLLGEIRPLNFKGRAEAFSVAAAGEGEQTVRLRFKVSDPHLWWPAGHGEQNLYAMTLRFEDASGRVTDGTGFQFGIRTIEMRPAGGPDAKPAPDTYNWLTVVNGKPIFLKGTGWCTMDPLMRFTKDRYERFLGAAHRQNANFIRAWGCGIVESEEFYDLCDRYGICVMQEWPTAWDSYPTQPKEALAETVIRGTRRLRNRPSLVFWCGGNEGKAPLFDTPTYSVENLNLIGRLTYENDGTRPWHRQEGWSGGSYHDYSASWDGKNPAVMMTKESKFFGEFGVDCLPSAESIRKYTPADELAELERTKGTADWKISPTGAIAHHTPKFNHAVDLKRQLQHVTMTLPCDSLENAVLGSQIGQALGVRYTLERSRTRFPACAGASMYKLNDIYPAASWATVDWYGTEKYASFVVADAFKPLTAIARLERLRSEGKPVDIPLFVVDDGDELAGTKAWTVSLRALDAKLKGIRRLDVRGAGSVGAVRRLGELKLSAEEAASVPLWVVAEVVADGRTVARNFYYVNFEAECGCLFRMPQTTLDAKAADGAYVIRNTGDVPAINVHFVCPKVSDRFVCEDSYFWLEPGEERRIEVNFTEGVEGVRCWNLR